MKDKKSYSILDAIITLLIVIILSIACVKVVNYARGVNEQNYKTAYEYGRAEGQLDVVEDMFEVMEWQLENYQTENAKLQQKIQTLYDKIYNINYKYDESVFEELDNKLDSFSTNEESEEYFLNLAENNPLLISQYLLWWYTS